MWRQSFRTFCPRWCPGPNSIPARELKECALVLSPVLNSLSGFLHDCYRTNSMENIIHHISSQWTLPLIIKPPQASCTHLTNYLAKRNRWWTASCQSSAYIWTTSSLHIRPGVAQRMLCHVSHTPCFNISMHQETLTESFLLHSILSSANTIQRLYRLNIPPLLIHWVHRFLSNQPPSVKVDTMISPPIITNIPQGCVLSPFLHCM